MRRSDKPGARLRQSHPSQIRDAADQRMMDKDGLRRDSLREGLKTKGAILAAAISKVAPAMPPMSSLSAVGYNIRRLLQLERMAAASA